LKAQAAKPTIHDHLLAVGSQFRSWFANGPVLVWISVSLFVASENGKTVVVGDSA
jgi:hypothetical protein